MRDNLGGAIWRLAIFLMVCLLGMFALFAVFGQLRFEKAQDYRAHFSNVSGLETSDFVRIAGVEVGKVQKINVNDDGTLMVDFTTDDSVVLTEGSRAVIRYDDLIGGRYLALVEGAGGTKKLNPARPSRWPRPSRPWTSMRSSAGSGRCSGRWIPNRSTNCPAS